MNEHTHVRENVVLVGMPGAGKTTIGVLLAERLGFDFVNLPLIRKYSCWMK